MKLLQTPFKQADFKNAFYKLTEARHHDPFSLLGKHVIGAQEYILVHIPKTTSLKLAQNDSIMHRIMGTDLFWWLGEKNEVTSPYKLIREDNDGHESVVYDPYCFLPVLSDFDIHLFGEGKHWHVYRILGSHEYEMDQVKGVSFAVWAPNAVRVSVVGDFNQWDGRVHPMRVRGDSGIWELFLPGLGQGVHYKYEIRGKDGANYIKSDPYGQAFEFRPQTATYVLSESQYQWQDDAWLMHRKSTHWNQQPVSIYEVHLGSWKRNQDGRFMNYRELAHQLVDYVKNLGFTHIELLPITEHPFDGSWGYQTTGYFAVTSRFGTPDDFRYFVDYSHQQHIGIILDWVPAHFPKDAHGLANFDGSALYEHSDPRQGEHRDWGTLIFNFGRNEVKNFLLSSAIFWIEEFHLDGLRVDAVASMLYLDYSREAGEWIPNRYGGRENLEAIEFIKELNCVTHDLFPGILTIAEESTAWPQVTRPTYLGGLGFSMKWNMGWMHDTLSYMKNDPIYRHYHHDLLTFGLLYAFTENFVLPFSHDEVVHMKNAMLDKMPGDRWRQFATLRLLYTYYFSYPGKKLLFMGCEFAQDKEWDHDQGLEWYLEHHPLNKGVQMLVKDVANLYQQSPALHQYDFDWNGFEWIDCHDSSQSVLSYQRKSDHEFMIVVLNFTPVPRHHYRIGVPYQGEYQEVLNSDSGFYGGSDVGNEGVVKSEETAWMNLPYSLDLHLPPLGGIILKLK